MDERTPVLETRKLGISFGGLKAVNDFNIKIYPGELVGLIGPNGAGKTTVFNLLTGVYVPTEGTVILNGQPLNGKKTYQFVEAGVARTFQNIRLFRQMTVIDNVKAAFTKDIHYNLFDASFRTKKYWDTERRITEKAMELLECINTIRDRFGVAILLIEHDMSLVMNVCERIQVIDYGQTIASGLPEEIANNPKVIAAYLGE